MFEKFYCILKYCTIRWEIEKKEKIIKIKILHYERSERLFVD